MKHIFLLSLIVLFTASAAFSAESLDGPRCTQDEAWQSVVDNAFNVADQYAIAHNSRATFQTSIEDYNFVKQFDGPYKGNYLLLITVEHGQDVCVATLFPLFDVNKPAFDLNTEKPLWQVIRATLNDQSF
jgi:hypothetical protein